MAPKDYVEPPKLAKQSSTQKRAVEEQKDADRLAKVASKYTRIDGKELTAKQKREILDKLKADEKAENPDFDPRKNRITHGIRGYMQAGTRAHEPGAF